MLDELAGALVAGDNWVASPTVSASRAMSCVVHISASIRTVNPAAAGGTLVSVATRMNGGAWRAKGIWAGFSAAHPVVGGLTNYQASAMTQVDMKPGETWNLGCALEAVSGAWVGLPVWCSTSWVCH